MNDPLDQTTPISGERGTALSDTVDARDTVGEAKDPSIPGDLAVDGYEVREVLGRGGMGEVLLAEDLRIGRDVAIKRMRNGSPTGEAVVRFLREAKIQARLDHPAIVPVHELGRAGDGRPYFTMKRLSGVTLQQLLADERVDEQKKLLRTFVDVCLAIEFAHRRGVIHRDLKPSNIMLGDFGEVYILDWGVARVVGETESDSRGDITSLDGQTLNGQLLGTPGYMAPEQLRGDPIAPSADVYALGSVLFEILARVPLHARGAGAIGSTLGTPTASPAARAPARAIAPELDGLCVAALADSPADRPTARALAEQIQQYLDGDRDLERRRLVALRELQAGRSALEAGDRASAVRAVGRALALDPSSGEAAELVMSLVTEEPKVPPRELEALLEAEDETAMRERSGRAVVPYAMFYLILPFLALVEVKSWPLLIGLYASVTLVAVAALINWRVRPLPLWSLLGVHLISLVFMSRLFGPLMLTPIVICAILLSLTSIEWMNRRPLAVMAWTVSAVMLPFALEWLGILAPSWTLTDRGFETHGSIFEASSELSMIMAIGATLLGCVLVAAYARRTGRDRSDSQRKLRTQAWHLRHLLPQSRRRTEGPRTES